jgi:DNA-binding GntR family transcriptional regulator
MTRTRPQTARHYVVATLRADILRGHHPAGSRLRQEEVAARLGVSTTPVREAFRDLLAEGLIEFDTHRGAIVRGLTLADLHEIYELRVVLEPMLAARTVRQTSDAQLAAAEELYHRLCAEPDPERWAVLNVAFHKALNVASAETRLARIVNNLAEAATSYVAMSMHAAPDLMRINNDDHAALLDAYRKRDVKGARVRTAAHLQQTLEYIDRGAQPRARARLTV